MDNNYKDIEHLFFKDNIESIKSITFEEWWNIDSNKALNEDDAFVMKYRYKNHPNELQTKILNYFSSLYKIELESIFKRRKEQELEEFNSYKIKINDGIKYVYDNTKAYNTNYPQYAISVEEKIIQYKIDNKFDIFDNIEQELEEFMISVLLEELMELFKLKSEKHLMDDIYDLFHKSFYLTSNKILSPDEKYDTQEKITSYYHFFDELNVVDNWLYFKPSYMLKKLLKTNYNAFTNVGKLNSKYSIALYKYLKELIINKSSNIVKVEDLIHGINLLSKKAMENGENVKYNYFKMTFNKSAAEIRKFTDIYIKDIEKDDEKKIVRSVNEVELIYYLKDSKDA